MVRLNARAEALHDLLEKMLDSDSSMKEMNLTAKLQVWKTPLYMDGWHCFWSKHRESCAQARAFFWQKGVA